MLSSSFFDIAIGVAFIFLLLSLIASTIKELIASLVNMRGKELLRGLQSLLNDTDANANGLVARLYNHGAIFGLFKGDFNDKKPRNLPSYISPGNFVMAILDVLPAAAAALPVPPAAPPAGLPAALAPLWNAARTLEDNPPTEKVGRPLLFMIEAATSINDLRTSVEKWYNSAMDRVSGYYKYHNQWILFWIGIVLAVALNADTVNIVKQLSRNPTLRESVVAAAQSYQGSKTGEAGKTDDLAQRVGNVAEQISQVKGLGIPLGWPLADSQKKPDGYWWLPTSIGWLLTAVGVSLGASFWFDILNKFIVVRSTIKPGEKTQTARHK